MSLEKIEQDQYYHIYNRGIDSGVIFKNNDNMSYFLDFRPFGTILREYMWTVFIIINCYALSD